MPFRSRIIELTIGYTVSNIIGYAGDYLIYPFVIYKLGIINGGLMMTAVSFITCLTAIKFYGRIDT